MMIGHLPWQALRQARLGGWSRPSARWTAQWPCNGTAPGLRRATRHPARTRHGTAQWRPWIRCHDITRQSHPPIRPITDHPTPASLRATALIDSEAPAVRAFAGAHARGDSERERAVALYLAVRD